MCIFNILNLNIIFIKNNNIENLEILLIINYLYCIYLILM